MCTETAVLKCRYSFRMWVLNHTSITKHFTSCKDQFSCDLPFIMCNTNSPSPLHSWQGVFFLLKPDLHVQCLLGVLPHQAVCHYDEVSCLARRVRGQGRGRVTDGTLKVQRAAGQETLETVNYIYLCVFMSVCVQGPFMYQFSNNLEREDIFAHPASL